MGAQMANRRISRSVMTAVAVATVLAVTATAAHAGSLVYSFAGDEDGEYPSTDLVVDPAGNLYGTSVLGGDFSTGTVFELIRSGDTWTHTVLYSLTGGLD